MEEADSTIQKHQCKSEQKQLITQMQPPSSSSSSSSSSRRKALMPKSNNNHIADSTTSCSTTIRPLKHQTSSDQQVRLAALAVSFNARLRSSDMPHAVQERALRHARALLDSAADHRRPNPTILARSLKKEFDSVYGPAWHCVVGKSFGSFVTHSPGGFVYFSVDSLSFLLFKTEVHVIAKPSP